MLAITTCQRYPEPPPNLLPLADELQRRGMAARFAPWQSAPDAPHILPLCAWDYADNPHDFAAWIRTAAARGQQFANPPELMLWNMDKRYLLDLVERGADVIPSVYLPSENEQSEFRQNEQSEFRQNEQSEFRQNEQSGLADIMRSNAWTEAVVKPAVGQSGTGVRKIRLAEIAQAGKALHAKPDHAVSDGLIIQPYIREIESAGETSLVFFNGAFSHAVRRQPPQGEWRANSAYGVTVLPVCPPDKVVETAAAILRLLPQIPLYARVDGTIIGQRFLLNELELIEPALYLHTNAGAAARLAEVLAAKIV